MDQKQRVKKVLFYGLNILLPITIGGCIYLFFRQSSYISIIAHQIIMLPNDLVIRPNWLNDLICFYLTDFFWAYALTFSISSVFDLSINNRVLIFALCSGFCFFIEVFQRFGVIQGTFDWIDVIVEILAVIAALWIIRRYEEVYHEKKQEDH